MHPLASRLLRWLAMAAAASAAGCLWPSEYYAVSDAPSSPPVIDKRLVDPDPTLEVDGRLVWDPATTPTLDFQLRRISDDNTGDTLYVRWYVALDERVFLLNRATAQEDIAPTGSVDRSSQVFSLTPAMLAAVDVARNAAGDGGVLLRPYPVEVQVSDRAPQGLNGRTLPGDALVDRWRWLVMVASTEAQ